MKIRSREALIDFVNHGNQVAYLLFWGHTKPNHGITKTCFSQWYDSPFEVDKDHFMTAEHYMMYRKALLFEDLEAGKQLLKVTNPGAAKDIGRKVRGFNQPVWEKHRFQIVVDGNLAKFSSHPELKDFLLGTGDTILVEASPVDRIWGIGLAQDHADCTNPNNWKGENLLGFALMEVRDRLY